MVHVGVDLDKRSSQIAVLSEDGEIVQHRLANDAARLTKFFSQLPPHTPIAIEASGTWWWLVDLLPRVWIPPTALREARELIRHRIQLVWLRGVIRNRLQAMLARRNLQPTSGQSWLTQRGQRELQRLPLGETPSRIREDCGALLPTLDAQIRRLDADLVTRWGADARVRRLTTIPGIGPFIAIVLVLELGDIARFASAKRVASYVGLTPRVRGSAGRVRAGHITKEGNRLLRWVLVLAATQAIRRPGPLRAWFHAVKKRRGKKVARVALARRLVEIVFHVWKQECDYFTVVRHGVVRG